MCVLFTLSARDFFVLVTAVDLAVPICVFAMTIHDLELSACELKMIFDDVTCSMYLSSRRHAQYCYR